jgi:thermosome
MSRLPGRQIPILKKGATRLRKRDARRANILAARAIAELVSRTLGPRGRDKILVDYLGDLTVTNDGATILRQMEIYHPAAKLFADIARTQDREVGDGTTSVLVLAAALLAKYQDLSENGIHPTTILNGYKIALEETLKQLHAISVPLDLTDDEALLNVARTSMASKNVGTARDHLARLSLQAIRRIAEQKGNRTVADVDQIQILVRQGKSLLETELVDGMLLDEKVLLPTPARITDAKIAILDCSIELKKTRFQSDLKIGEVAILKGVYGEKARVLRTQVDRIKSTGANVVLCKRDIDPIARQYLARDGILAVRRIRLAEMEKIPRATGGRIVSDVWDLEPTDLGEAKVVEQRKVGKDYLVFIEGCSDPRSVSVLIRAGLRSSGDEAERALKDSLYVLRDVMEDGRVVAGAGSVEMELAARLRRYHRKVRGRTQIAVQAFVDSLEAVPRVLAQNAGAKPLDIVTDLRARHSDRTNRWAGFDQLSRRIVDAWSNGIIEPARVKEVAIKLAYEAATVILRVDDVIMARRAPPEPHIVPPKLPPPPEAPSD